MRHNASWFWAIVCLLMGINPGPSRANHLAYETPAPTLSPPPEPTPTQIGGFPKQLFTPYVDVCIYPRFFITTQYQNMGTKYYTLGFVVSDSGGNGIPTWGGYMEYVTSGDWYRDQIQALRAQGGEIIVSFGGATGIELARAHDRVESLRSAYQSVIDTYDLTRVDFDIEGAAIAETASIDRRNKAIKILQYDNPDLVMAYCLPVLPSGLTQDGINLLQNAIDNEVRVDLVNIMAMDYGDGPAPNPEGQMGEYAIAAAQSLFSQLKALYPHKTDPQLWRMVGITPMIGRNDILSEVFDLQDAAQVLAFAQDNELGMISMWSANRDNGSCGAAAYSSPLCSSLNQEDFAFSMIFEQFTASAPPITTTSTTTSILTSTSNPTTIATSTSSTSVTSTTTNKTTSSSSSTTTTATAPTPRTPAPTGDYNGDGTSDVALYRPSVGLWLVRDLPRIYFGTEVDEPIPADYDGDGTWDYAYYRPSTGFWKIRNQTQLYFGNTGEIPVPADYNGDGTSEIAFFRPSEKLWNVLDTTRFYFGASSDTPMAYDFNGDGDDDAAIYRAATAFWKVRDITQIYFGAVGDKPVPADYNGDGTDDIAWFRPSVQLWRVYNLTQSYFGRSDDFIFPADFNGDGTDDYSYFRPPSLLWRSKGVTRIYFGQSGDWPITR